MAYYTTDQISRAAGCSPAAARYYLRKGGFTAKITDHRYPRHSRQYSWPESALSWLRGRLTARPISPAPNPLHWLTRAEALDMLHLKKSQLARLVANGTLRHRRALIRSPKGTRWRSYISAEDASTYNPARFRALTHHTPDSMQTHLPALLLRAWLVLLSTEQATGSRCLAIYKTAATTINLHNEQGQQYTLPTDNPESCAEIPDTWLSVTLSAEDWATAQTTFAKALQELSRHRRALLTIAADTINIWSGSDHSPLAEYPLPVTA